MRDLIEWLAKKDRTGIVKKAGETASKLYRWADDFEHAEELESVIEESYKEKTGSDAPKP